MTFRQLAALGVAAVGVEAVLSAATPDDPRRQRVIAHLTPALPSLAHLLALFAGVALLLLVPQLWRGTRTAVPLAIAGLVAIAVLNLVKGFDYDESALDLCLVCVLGAGRAAFPLGSRNRPDLAAVTGAVAAWALTYCALLVRPLATDRGHTIRHALHTSIVSVGTWRTLAEVLIGTAGAITLLAVRSLLRPAASANGHREDEHQAARGIVERYGSDSLSSFLLRPDKALHFAAGGVLSYRVIGETAVVSGDPVAPDGAAPEVLSSFRRFAREQGWHVALWGSSERNLDAYRQLGLHAVCAGEEAFVAPERFTLEGRRVRKLRQSVQRIDKRGWRVETCDGRDLDDALERELDDIAAAWRSTQRRIIGFAMGMGVWSPERRPTDLYVLGRSPEGELRAVMRFVDCCGSLSLDTMHRVGETPNGLNEALVARALELARDRGVPEVSLNFAGMAHLVRHEEGLGITRTLARALSRLLGRHFQLLRLVRFNEKFSPEWRPRYLVYESRATLPLCVIRVLQAEGYLPERGPRRRRGPWRPARLPVSPQADASR